MIERGAGEEVRRTDREPFTREGDDVHYYFPPWLCLLGVRVFFFFFLCVCDSFLGLRSYTLVKA